MSLATLSTHSCAGIRQCLSAVSKAPQCWTRTLTSAGQRLLFGVLGPRGHETLKAMSTWWSREIQVHLRAFPRGVSRPSFAEPYSGHSHSRRGQSHDGQRPPGTVAISMVSVIRDQRQRHTRSATLCLWAGALMVALCVVVGNCGLLRSVEVCRGLWRSVRPVKVCRGLWRTAEICGGLRRSVEVCHCQRRRI